MTKEETIKILMSLNADFNEKITPEKVAVWYDQLKLYEYMVVSQATKNLIRSWEFSYFPKIAHLVRHIELLTEKTQTPIELWRIAERRIKNSAYITQDQFDELPEPIKRYFGSKEALREVGQLPLDQIPNQQARFLNNINEIIRNSKAWANLPENIRLLLKE